MKQPKRMFFTTTRKNAKHIYDITGNSLKPNLSLARGGDLATSYKQQIEDIFFNDHDDLDDEAMTPILAIINIVVIRQTVPIYLITGLNEKYSRIVCKVIYDFILENYAHLVQIYKILTSSSPAEE